MTTTTKTLCISADSHVVEPGEVFAGLDKRFGDRAPRMEYLEERGDTVNLGNGNYGFSVGLSLLAGTDPGAPESLEMAKKGFEIARPGVLDPKARWEEQTIDGIDAEVLYPTLFFHIYSIEDIEIVNAAFANYNDWLCNYASQLPGRLFPLSLVHLNDIPHAIEEMERTAELGAVGVCIPCTAPPDRLYSDPYYDPFWAAAQEMKMPLTMHIFTGATPNHGLPNWGRQNSTLANVGIQRSIMDLITGGVCERFPDLRFVPTEFETGWVAHFLQRFDWNWHRAGGFRTYQLMKRRPGEYWHQNFLITFEDDEIGIRTRDIIGVDNLMWGNDYPHGDSIYPDSQNILDRIFEGVPSDERYKITAANVCKLYHLPFES
jgi:predicted TIM-barrel fold metal-dependent hydrolase